MANLNRTLLVRMAVIQMEIEWDVKPFKLNLPEWIWIWWGNYFVCGSDSHILNWVPSKECTNVSFHEPKHHALYIPRYQVTSNWKEIPERRRCYCKSDLENALMNNFYSIKTCFNHHVTLSRKRKRNYPPNDSFQLFIQFIETL